MLSSLHPQPQAVERQIDDRGGIEREQLTQDQPSHNRDTQGRRSSYPVPVPSANGSAPNSAAIVVIRMGRKRNMHASKIASIGFFPSWRFYW